jgi:hypothetical protein
MVQQFAQQSKSIDNLRLQFTTIAGQFAQQSESITGLRLQSETLNQSIANLRGEIVARLDALESRERRPFSSVNFYELQRILDSYYVTVRILQPVAVAALWARLAAQGVHVQHRGVPFSFVWGKQQEVKATPTIIKAINEHLARMWGCTVRDTNIFTTARNRPEIVAHNQSSHACAHACGEGAFTASGKTDISFCPNTKLESSHCNPGDSFNAGVELKIPGNIKAWGAASRRRSFYEQNVPAQPICELLSMPSWNSIRFILFTDASTRYHVYIMVDSLEGRREKFLYVVPNVTADEAFCVLKLVLTTEPEAEELLKEVFEGVSIDQTTIPSLLRRQDPTAFDPPSPRNNDDHSPNGAGPSSRYQTRNVYRQSAAATQPQRGRSGADAQSRGTRGSTTRSVMGVLANAWSSVKSLFSRDTRPSVVFANPPPVRRSPTALRLSTQQPRSACNQEFVVVNNVHRAARPSPHGRIAPAAVKGFVNDAVSHARTAD